MHGRRAVSLTIPALAGYVGLPRLALVAVCAQTALDAEGVTDLKLALTEAAHAFVSEDGVAPGQLSFRFSLEHDRLVIDIEGRALRRIATEESELSEAILGATVDEWARDESGVHLVKHLVPADE